MNTKKMRCILAIVVLLIRVPAQASESDEHAIAQQKNTLQHERYRPASPVRDETEIGMLSPLDRVFNASSQALASLQEMFSKLFSPPKQEASSSSADSEEQAMEDDLSPVVVSRACEVPECLRIKIALPPRDFFTGPFAEVVNSITPNGTFFLEQSNLLDTLSTEKQYTALDLICILDDALRAFHDLGIRYQDALPRKAANALLKTMGYETLKNPACDALRLNGCKHVIMSLILKDHPEALVALVNNNKLPVHTVEQIEIIEKAYVYLGARKVSCCHETIIKQLLARLA